MTKSLSSGLPAKVSGGTKVNIIICSIFLLAASGAMYGQTNLEDHNKAVLKNNEAHQKINSGSPHEAISLLVDAVELDPNIREVYINIAYAGNEVKNYKFIEKHLIKAKSIFPEDDEICYYLGNAYQNQGMTEKAVKEYSLAIKYCQKREKNFPLMYAFYFNRANCYLKLDKADLAVRDYSDSLILKPENENAYTNRGIAHIKLKKKQEACDDWNKAVSLGQFSTKKYLEKYCK